MQNIGLILIILGSLAGSLVAVLDPVAVDWLYFLLSLGIGALGVALVQVGIHREATESTRLESNSQILHDSLKSIVTNMEALDHDKATIDTYELPDRIDSEFRDHISAFVDARQSIIHIFGTSAYADIMSHFAAGERYLNRVWSAAADGYVNEANAYIERSRIQFTEALSKLAKLSESAQTAA